MSLKLSRQFVASNEQAMVERSDVPRSRFRTQWTRKQSMNGGLVVPFMWDEALPADFLKYDVTALVRMNTPIFPAMSNIKADVHFFYVPNRLIWSEFQRFMGEQTSTGQSIDVAHPNRSVAPTVGTLLDYLGLPVNLGNLVNVSALPWRAYTLIWSEWYRDQNLQNAAALSTASGADTTTNTDLLPRNKFHDYFASALPWTQKFTAPVVPIAGTAPVRGIGITAAGSTTPQAVTETDTLAAGRAATYNRWWQSANVWVQGSPGTSAPWVFADLSAATGMSVNSLRQAIQIQRLLEKDARGGTRYPESVFMHFGVRPPDFRVQRPEFIGGGSGMINITPVAQTVPNATIGTIPQRPAGHVGGAATGVIQARASYASTEHGIVLGLISIRAEQAYQQGVPRKFRRSTRYDYYWPTLAQLGEQAIRRQEIFATGTADDELTFGFQERYAEYRQYYSEIAGRMRSTAASTLDAWHLAENYSTAPVLGDTWIRADFQSFDRVLQAGSAARTNSDQFICDIMITRDATRAMPMHGTPVGLGRF